MSAKRQRNVARTIRRKVRRLRPKYVRCAGRTLSKRSVNVGFGRDTFSNVDVWIDAPGVDCSSFACSGVNGTGFLEKLCC